VKKLSVLLFSGVLFASPLLQAESARPVSLERKQAFTNIDDGIAAIEDQLDADKPDWTVISNMTSDLQQDAQYLSTAFEKKSYKDSRARERIWDNYTDFDRRLSVLTRSLNDLQSFVADKNKRGVEVAWDAADSTCNACHRRYRTFW